MNGLIIAGAIVVFLGVLGALVAVGISLTVGGSTKRLDPLFFTSVIVAIAGVAFLLAPGAFISMNEFNHWCTSQGGHVITGRSILLCVSPDGRILN